MMRPSQAPTEKIFNEGGKGRTKRAGPKSKSKMQTQNGTQRGKGTNYVPKPSPVARNIL
jgi:hypothetical protein